MLQLLSIITALIVGHSCQKLPVSAKILNNVLNFSVLLILFVMGYDFASNSEDLSHESLHLISEVGIFTLLLFICNFLAVYFFVKKDYQLQPIKTAQYENLFSYMRISIKYLLYVIGGIAVGHVLKWRIDAYLNTFISAILFLVIFIIGHQLRQQGISLKSILANKFGFAISIVIMFSSLIAGLLSAKILHMQIGHGLMLSAGFGWYTLSGILNGQLINHHIGTTAFFIDFTRELIALFLIPIIGRKFPIPLVGYSASTADFILPIIKLHLGDEIIPVAITSGIVLTILVPILIPFFQFILC